MANSKPPFGPDNPHPMSVVRTELVWEGKYDDLGNPRGSRFSDLRFPLQKVETIDQPRDSAVAQGLLFEPEVAHLDDSRNMLIWGDNGIVAASLISDFRSAVDLIYIDPPFNVEADFTMDVAIGDGSEAVAKDQSALELVAYRDMWGRGVDSYLQMMFERLTLTRELLKDSGSLYMHCDPTMSHYLKLLCDEVFGAENFRNEIVWCYSGGGTPKNDFPRKHDIILRYTKTDKYFFEVEYKPYKENTQAVGKHSTYVSEDKREIDLDRGTPVTDWWSDIKTVTGWNSEKVGYPTQKPEALIERIINASCPSDGLVLDLFCGSGTVGAVAERMGRRWVMSDLGRFAVHTSRKRLIESQRELHSDGSGYRAFDIFNLGRYERQWWQRDRLAGADDEHRKVILEFFRAEPLDSAPSDLLHGRKGGAVCHVDGIDSTFSGVELEAVALAAKDAGAAEVVCLAWEFEMNLALQCERLQAETGVTVRLIQIPREIMERNRRQPPPFLEVAMLAAAPVFHTAGNSVSVDIKLESFVPSLSEVPSRELEVMKERAVSGGFDFIDFWAVDFDYRLGEPFRHDWQDYRLLRDRSLKKESDQHFVYDGPGDYVACVKVIDVFGGDTSVAIPISYE